MNGIQAHGRRLLSPDVRQGIPIFVDGIRCLADKIDQRWLFNLSY